MREQDRTPPGLRVHALDDVLEERVVRPSLRRHTVHIPAIGISSERIPVPLLDRVRRIGQHHIELPEFVVLQKRGLGKRIAPHDLEVIDAVQEEVHPGNRGRDQVDVLPVEFQAPVLLALLLELERRDKQHPARPAGRIIDRLALLRVEHERHEFDERPVRVELRSRMPGIVRELLDQVLVALPEFVLRHMGERERLVKRNAR